MTPAKLEAAKAEIRAIFSNEVEAIEEFDGPKLRGYSIFERLIRLAGMNAAEGKTCVSHIVYAIHHRDGYWEQIAAHNGPWEA